MYNTGVIFIAGLLIGSVLLFVAIVLCVEFGRRLGRRHLQGGAKELTGYAPIESALFALLGLLIAFTFYGAATRFDYRRMLIIDETNAIGTAYLRLQTLPAAVQPPLKALFKDYVGERLAVYRDLDDAGKIAAHLRRCDSLQRAIWDKAVASAPKAPDNAVRVILLPALNQMFDIASTRVLSVFLHPPMAIYGLMLLIVLICSVLAGLGMATVPHRSWVHIVAFALVLSATIYVILDMEYPRKGLITINEFDQTLVNLEKGM